MCIHDMQRRVSGTGHLLLHCTKIPTCRTGNLANKVNEMNEARHHVVVVGAGFGGLEFTRALAGA
ncbi:hypothetical protein EN972_30115, partial [Mesorhizobium sp. M7A.F.Ca.CA.002.07.1.1]